MNVQEILSRCDHTFLSQTATWQQIQEVCDDGIRFATASVCIPPSYVARAKAYVGGRIPICTVIGFPNGYQTTAVKVYETEEAIRDGADEIDMVIHLGELRAGNDAYVLQEIKRVKAACGNKILKVIVETCLLTEEEKVRVCDIVTQSGADYIKTSTGFGGGGATREDVALFARHVGQGVRIKAAGGIVSLADAQDFLDLGADRLGTSRVVKAVKKLREHEES